MKLEVLITGATGFVGMNLIPYLNKLSIGTKALNRSDLSGDVKFDNIDAIIHLAGKAHDIKKASNPEEYYKVNFELTKKLYDDFLKSDARKFIFIS